MKITVFICTYNRGSLINNTLKGIIEGQTKLPNEIVVVNGGGENDCSEMARKVQKYELCFAKGTCS